MFGVEDEEHRLADKVMVGVHSDRDGCLSMSSVDIDGSVLQCDRLQSVDEKERE